MNPTRKQLAVVYGGALLEVVLCLAMLFGGSGILPGPRFVGVFRDALGDATEITALQSGEYEKYWQTKGHIFVGLSENAKDSNSNPSRIVESAKKVYGDKKTPVLIIGTLNGGRMGSVLYCESLPDGWDAEYVQSRVKEKGG